MGLESSRRDPRGGMIQPLSCNIFDVCVCVELTSFPGMCEGGDRDCRVLEEHPWLWFRATAPRHRDGVHAGGTLLAQRRLPSQNGTELECKGDSISNNVPRVPFGMSATPAGPSEASDQTSSVVIASHPKGALDAVHDQTHLPKIPTYGRVSLLWSVPIPSLGDAWIQIY